MPQHRIDVSRTLIGLKRTQGNQMRDGSEQQHSTNLVQGGKPTIDGPADKAVTGFTSVKK